MTYYEDNTIRVIGETGTKTYYFRVTDASGNSTVVTKTVKIDNTAPSTPDISMTTPAGDYTAGTWAAQSVSVTLSGSADAHSGLAGRQYKIDGGAWQDGSAYTFNVSGIYTFHYRLVDNAVDLEAPGEPTIAITPSYTTDWTNETVTLTASMSSDNLTAGESIIYEVSEDGTTFSEGDSLTFSGEGTHTGWFRVTDEGGNKTTVSRTVKIDKTAPTKPDTAMTSGGTAYTEGAWATASVDIALSGSADAASGVGGYQYKIGSGEWQSGDAYTFDASGEYTVNYRSVDGAGNISETGSKTVKVDVEAPEPFSITASATVIDSIDISASTTDVQSGMAAYRVFNGTSWSNWKTAVDETLTGYSRGQKVTIKVEAKDIAGNVRLAEATISTLANTAPVCVDDTYTMKEGASRAALLVLANDTDADIGRADSDTIRVASVSALSKPAAGRLTLDNGNVYFAPAADYNGTVTFTYAATDSKGANDTGLAAVAVTAVNDAPTANSDSVMTDEDAAKTFSVLANDEDIDSALSIKALDNPTHGTVAKSGDGLRYTPAKDFNGSDSFTYTITDG